MRKDPFLQYRQELKGVFVATKGPKSNKVIAKAGLQNSTKKWLLRA